MMSGTQTGTQFRQNGGHQDRRHKINTTAGTKREWGVGAGGRAQGGHDGGDQDRGHKIDMMAGTQRGEGDTRWT